MSVDTHASIATTPRTCARTVHTGVRDVRRRLPPGAAEPSRRRLSRSAQEASRRPRTYDVRWFPNRWPAMPDDRCEVILYTPEHDATLLVARRSRGAQGHRSLGEPHRRARRAARDRVRARLREPRRRGRGDDHAPARPDLRVRLRPRGPGSRELERGSRFNEPGERLVADAPGWRAWVPEASDLPLRRCSSCRTTPVPDLPSLDDAGREALARVLVDVLERLDRLFDAQTPYMLWIHQRPFDGGDWPMARLHVEIVSPWRAPGVPRYHRGR